VIAIVQFRNFAGLQNAIEVPERFLSDVLLVGRAARGSLELLTGQSLQIGPVAQVQPGECGFIPAFSLPDPRKSQTRRPT